MEPVWHSMHWAGPAQKFLSPFSEPFSRSLGTLSDMATVSAQPPMEMDRNIALAELIHTHQAGVWRYLRYLGAKFSEADDLTQETFLAVTGVMGQTNFEKRSTVQTAAYLRKVARNRLLMARRSQSREIPTVDLAAAETIWAESTKDGRLDDYLVALADCLEKGLKGSDSRARQALDKFYRNQQSRTEIAKELNMTSEGVKTLLRRTRDLLRKCIERRIRPVARIGKESLSENSSDSARPWA